MEGQEATEVVQESPSVVAEVTTSDDGNAPTSTETSTESVTQQESFAKRLKESTDKAIADERTKWEQEVNPKLSYLEKQAKVYGFNTVDEYTRALDAHMEQQAMEQEAQRQGIDPEIYAQHLQPLNQENEQLKQKLQSYEQSEQQKEVQQSWNALYSTYPSLVDSSQAFNEGKNPDWFSSEMQALVGKGYDPIHAYELSHKETLFKQKEQEVLARVTGRDGKQILPSVDSPTNMTLDPANMSKAQIDDISARVQRGERITL